MSTTATPIGIAVVEHSGHYLIGVRGPDSDLAGMAEFPGGKCLPDESPADCAVRECQEETGLTVVPVRRLHRRQYDYGHASVDLHFWCCRLVEPTDLASIQRDFRWLPRTELQSLNFPAGNAQVVAMLSAESHR